MKRKPNLLLNKGEPRPISIASDEPLLDPQLAAMLEARKEKCGESGGKILLFNCRVCICDF